MYTSIGWQEAARNVTFCRDGRFCPRPSHRPIQRLLFRRMRGDDGQKERGVYRLRIGIRGKRRRGKGA